jgi:hypothetical protein
MIECMSKFAAEGRRTQGGANSAQARKVDPVPLALTHRQIVELKTINATIPRRLRTVFTQRLAELLQGHADPGDGDVWRAAHQAAREIIAPKQPQTGEALHGFNVTP